MKNKEENLLSNFSVTKGYNKTLDKLVDKFNFRFGYLESEDKDSFTVFAEFEDKEFNEEELKELLGTPVIWKATMTNFIAYKKKESHLYEVQKTYTKIFNYLNNKLNDD